ncbi:MAG: glycogen/starch synthase [Thermodesulfobacteriota bacterium]|nr:glycogen/starch synthase [Thermodesulfobacteriota bacterium]
MTESLHILMIASENDALPECKVGGIGDFIRDVPKALAALKAPKCTVTVLVPSYGYMHKITQASYLTKVCYYFAGNREEADLYDIHVKQPVPGVRYLVCDHPTFKQIDINTQKPLIYYNDPPENPFATDATKFARFCAAVAEGLIREIFGPINRIHLHDWHMTFLLILRQFDTAYKKLQQISSIFTIHNLSLQGIRPFRNESSSLEAWYPHIVYSEEVLADPEYRDCINPMAVGIRLADIIHTVSPGYAEEIIKPSSPSLNEPHYEYNGGGNLGKDLGNAHTQKRLFGILNGCTYEPNHTMPSRGRDEYLAMLYLLHNEVHQWERKKVAPVHTLALQRVEQLITSAAHRPTVLLTSCTRIVDQKVKLMVHPKSTDKKKSALEQILHNLPQEAFCILLGTGIPQYEAFFLQLSYQYNNFLFLNGFSTSCANALYANGDIFLMPSSFEPCGITQMLSMREGQPCVVHAVGGLKDTVKDNINGFSFSGSNLDEQAEAFVNTVSQAINCKILSPNRYQAIAEAAFKERFFWKDSVQKYVTQLYKAI